MDHLCRVIVTAGVSLPTFFTGILLIFIFHYVLGVAPAPLGRSETILVLDGSQCDENGTIQQARWSLALKAASIRVGRVTAALS